MGIVLGVVVLLAVVFGIGSGLKKAGLMDKEGHLGIQEEAKKEDPKEKALIKDATQAEKK